MDTVKHGLAKSTDSIVASHTVDVVRRCSGRVLQDLSASVLKGPDNIPCRTYNLVLELSPQQCTLSMKNVSLYISFTLLSRSNHLFQSFVNCVSSSFAKPESCELCRLVCFHSSQEQTRVFHNQ